MGSAELPYSQKTYKENGKEASTHIKKTGSPDTVTFTPVSGWDGDHMLESSANMPWFQAWEVTCKDANASRTTLLEALIASCQQLIQLDKTLCLPLQDVCLQNWWRCYCPCGQVETGALTWHGGHLYSSQHYKGRKYN